MIISIIITKLENKLILIFASVSSIDIFNCFAVFITLIASLDQYFNFY